MSSPAFDPRDLRVSDEERAHVLALLERATGQGLLDVGEFSERSAAVIAARTRGQLNGVLVDLPGLQVAGRPLEQANREVSQVGAIGPGYSGAPAHWSGSSADTLELTSLGSRSFRGHWIAPAHIVIAGFGASTRLDFTEAQLTSRTVTVEFRSNFGGSTELVLPRGTSVRLDQLSMRGGSLQNRVPPGGQGPLEVVLVGLKKSGSVMIRHPRVKLFGGWT